MFQIPSKKNLSLNQAHGHTGTMSAEQQKSWMEEAALLEQGAIRAVPEGDDQPGPSTMLTLISFAFLTFNSAMAAYQSNGAMGAVSFVVFSFLDVALLFYCRRLYNRAPPGSLQREHFKIVAWLLTVMLTFAAFMSLKFWFSDKRQSGAKVS